MKSQSLYWNRVPVLCFQMFTYFDWGRTVLISHRPVAVTDIFCDFAARSIDEQFRAIGIVIGDWVQFDTGLNEAQVQDILQRVEERGRSEQNQGGY